MNIKCRLEDVEEIVENLNLLAIPDDIATTEDDTQILVSGYFILIPELELRLYDGILCNWDEEEQMYLPDVAITVFYEKGGDLEKYLYFESDGMEVSLYNWLGGKKSLGEIEKLECEIIIPEMNENQ